MSVKQTAALNMDLTTYAQGISQDTQSALAEFIAPSVVVGASVGKFKKYNNKQDFQLYETARPLGGAATRIQFGATDSDYNCKPQALEVSIDDAEYEAAGDSNSPKLEEAKIRSLVNACVLARESRALIAARNALAASPGGVWSDVNIDPVAEIDKVIENIVIAIGRMPNRIVFGISAWKIFRSNPKVAARQPGAAVVDTNFHAAAQMMLNPNIEIRVGLLSRDLNKLGNPKNVSNLVGSEVYIFYANQAPDVYDPSFAKTFMGNKGNVTAVRSYRDERSRSNILALDWSEDVQIVSAESAARLLIS